ncbi:MAG: hypothetical protein VX974_11650 [Pseudomonadota bacterium]|nr:hypothetical protein [Pseudomonadota bacterium]
MRYTNLADFLKRGAAAMAKGPIALIFAEDPVEVDSTILHHQKLGFKQVIVLAASTIDLEPELESTVHFVPYNMLPDHSVPDAVNAISDIATGQWLYYCFNAEYLFFPFCETRTVGEMATFHTEERRSAILTYVVDVYASDLSANPNAVNLKDAHMDRTGYFALGRPDENRHPKDRQLNFYGGLRWRFEEHIPSTRRKIDRISIFRATPEARLRDDFTFTLEEYNTYACPWHHNITGAVISFRTAKALRRNPGSSFDIHTFMWRNSTRFDWSSSQLMDLGLMEPGQWF